MDKSLPLGLVEPFGGLTHEIKLNPINQDKQGRGYLFATYAKPRRDQTDQEDPTCRLSRHVDKVSQA